MNHDEIIDLLTVVAAVDRRTVGEADVHTWHDLLADVAYLDAIQAVREFRRERPGVWLEPGHILEGVRSIRRYRQPALEPAREPLPELGPGYQEWLRTCTKLFGTQAGRGSLSVRCRHCSAPQGSGCVARGRGIRRISVFHQTRKDDAEKALAATQSEGEMPPW
ncbi:zinc finger domain-containing protein [Mycobacterium sp. NPDC051198]